MKILLHLEVAPSSTPAALDELFDRLRIIGFKAREGGSPLLESGKHDYETLFEARRAVGQVVMGSGVAVLDSRVFCPPRRRRKRTPAQRIAQRNKAVSLPG